MLPSYFLPLLALATAAPPAEDLPIQSDAARVFPGRVQPVLMNLCASCHCRPDHASGFKLVRVAESFANAQAAGHNLRMAAAFVTADNPAASPLLVKAITPHGGARDPAMPGRGHPAYRYLEAWAFAALPRPAAKPMAVIAPMETTVAPASPPPAPKPKANADDPFDPEAFNRAR